MLGVPFYLRYPLALSILVLGGYIVARNEPKRSTFYRVLFSLFISAILVIFINYVID